MLYIRSNKGFTLIEMSIVIIILGIALASMFSMYNIYEKDRQYKETVSHQASIESAISNFLAVYGRYPCPSPYNAQRGDLDYGHEGDCTDNTVAVGTCNNGQCIYQSTPARTALAFSGVPERVREGVLPFKTLNLDEEDIIDGYGNPFSYIVTERLATDGGFSAKGGAIEIVNESGRSSLSDEGSAHFVIISHGEDGNGAFTTAGGRIACNIAATDGENCDLENEAIFQVASRDDRNNGYDDYIYYFKQSDVPTWAYDYDNKTMDIVGGGTMGIGTKAGEFGEKIAVAGEVRATEKVFVEDICLNNNGGSDDDCFSPSLFTGSIEEGTGGMKCPEGQYMVGIKNAKPVCEDEIIISCPDGYIMKGIEDGKPVCNTAPPAPCEATDIMICDEVVHLDKHDDGFAQYVYSYTTDYKGDSMKERQERYKCVDGEWKRDTSKSYYTKGACGCTGQEPREREHNTCSSFYPGDYYEGHTYFTQTHTCLDGWSYYNPKKIEYLSYDTCECQEYTSPTTNIVYDCPDYYSGYNLYKTTQTCVNDKEGIVSSVLDSSHCECTTTIPETNEQNCGEYYVPGGKIYTTPAYYNCETDTLIPEYVDNQCVCNEGYVDNIAPVDAGPCPKNYDGERYYDSLIVSCGDDNIPTTSYGEEVNTCNCVDGKERVASEENCPLGNYTGKIINYEVLDCETGEYVHSRTVNTCACDPAKTDTRPYADCPGVISGKYYETGTLNCETGQFENYVPDYNTCECDDSKYIEKYSGCSDPSHTLGQVTTRMYLNCTNGKYDIEGEIIDTCRAPRYEWVAVESSNNTIEDTPISPYEIGGECNKDKDYGFTGCFGRAMGKFNNYDSCICTLVNGD